VVDRYFFFALRAARERIERAKALLVRDASPTDACFAVGFRSVGSFSARFRREVGRPPSAYREPAVPHCFVRNFGEAQREDAVVDRAA
jgi:AraC-like DNA-binding protein